MVRLTGFRARLLIAIGLPVGCGSTTKVDSTTRVESTTTIRQGSGSDIQPSPGDQQPLPTSSPHDQQQDNDRDVILESSGPVTIAAPTTSRAPAGRCGRDEYQELVCGGSKQACGPTASGITNATHSRLVITKQGQWGAFAYDEPATARYQETGGAPATRTPGSYCCYSSCTRLEVHPAAPRLVVPGGMMIKDHCLPAPPDGTAYPAKQAKQCPAAIGLAGQKRPFTHAGTDNCCYAVLAPIPEEPRRYRGRAARVDGEIREAGVETGDAWTGAMVVADVDPAIRQRLAGAWLREARMEHASIASFARLGLELIAVGAPPALLAATHRAAADEVAHAQLAFSLASSYADCDLGPAPFGAALEMTARGDCHALAVETFVDGCIAETVAAHTAQYAADTAADPVIRATQQRIADDESRHAELAWSILAWCYRRCGAALDEPLRQALARAGASRAIACTDCELTAHGLPCEHQQQHLHDEVIATVVTPVLESLLAQGSKPQTYANEFPHGRSSHVPPLLPSITRQSS